MSARNWKTSKGKTKKFSASAQSWSAPFSQSRGGLDPLSHGRHIIPGGEPKEALGLDNQIASIAPGLQADIIALDGDLLKVTPSAASYLDEERRGLQEHRGGRDSCLCWRAALITKPAA